MTQEMHVGSPRSRMDGRAKVTGEAKYAAEFTAPDLAHGHVVSSGIAKGRITRIDTSAALAVPGVVAVFTQENRPRTAWFDRKYQDEAAPPGSPFRPLYDGRILFSGQPVALVVVESGIARHAAALVRVEYEAEPHGTDLAAVRHKAYVPPKKRSGISPPRPRGDAEAALARAPQRVKAEYRIATEHHDPMEMHAATVVWEGEGRLTIHDKIQGVQNSQGYVCNVFGLSKSDVRVVTPFVGGAFGSGLRPQYQLFLGVMAALELRRSMRVVLARDQTFTLKHRPETINRVALGAAPDGMLQAVRHEAIAVTSRFEDYQEVVVNWSGLLYHCGSVELRYRIAQLDIETPGDMRAPGAPLGIFALESAMDELAEQAGMDPLELRLKNYTETDENENKSYTSKELHAAYRLGAERLRMDEELGIVRVPRVVAVAAGRILNPKTARSQVIGGVVWGISMALHEESMPDHALGHFMNHNYAEYHVPVNADIGETNVIFVEEHADRASPVGVKGLGEIGIVGTAAAVANAIRHASGVRVRDLPITVDKILAQLPAGP